MPAQSVYLQTEIIVSNASISSPVEIVSFTLPSAGIWDIDYFANGTYVSGLAGGPYWLQLYDSNNQPVQYSDRKVNMGSPISGRYFITTTGPATYKLKTYPDRSMVYRISPNEGRNGVVFSYAPSSPKGDKGDQGIQGPQGIKGDTGAVGPRGDKGDTGAVGPRGAQGPLGDTGAVGPKGDKGDTGAVGPMSQGPIFQAYQTVVQNLSINGTANLVFNATVINTDNCYNTQTGIFLPRQPGWYQINAGAFPALISGNADASWILSIVKNNNETVAVGPMGVVKPTWGTITLSSLSKTIYMNGLTDYLQCRLTFNKNSGVWSTGPGANATYFQACWLRS